VTLEGRAQLESLWFTSKIPKTHKAPNISVGVRHTKLISGDVKRGPIPAIGRFDFDQSSGAVGFKALDVVARAIANFFGCPHDLAREIFPS